MAFVSKLDESGNTLIYSTYLGGTCPPDLEDTCHLSGDCYTRAGGIAVDHEGNAYVTGETGGDIFPVRNPAQDYGGESDAFACKINPTGSALLYSTFIGGSSGERGCDIAVDCQGGAFVVGNTWSPDFPTEDPYQADYGGGSGNDAFVTKLDPTGNTRVMSTFLGGSLSEQDFLSIAVDNNGSAYVAGYTSSYDLPTLNAVQPDRAGGLSDVFLAKFEQDPPLDCDDAEEDGDRLLLSAHVGGATPTGGWDKYTDANVHWRFDFQYSIKDHLRIMAIAGLSQFTTEPFGQNQHPRWTNLSANIRVIIPSSTQLKFFVQVGQGVFYPKSGSAETGTNAGLGILIPLMPDFDIDFGIDYFHIYMDDATDYLTVQLGVVFPLSRPNP
jgi:hypothetical protein